MSQTNDEQSGPDRRDGRGPREARIEVATGVTLRVLRWAPVPDDGATAQASAGPAPFLLVHGLASNARLWDGVARRLAASGSEVAAVDLRGHGRSDRPDGGYDFATIDEDLRSLTRAAGFDRPVAVGQSWGANVVLDLAVRHPGLLRGIVLVDGGLSDLQDAFPTWEECWARLAPPRLVGRPLAEIEGYMRSAHADWPEEGIAGALANFEVRPDGTIAPWLTRERHELILRSMWGQRPSALWTRLRVPAIVVPADTGAPEWTAGKRAGAEAAETTLRASGVPVRVEWLRGDHDIHAQHPDWLAGLLVEADRTGFFDVPAASPASLPATADA